jgi:pilus assembly protein Flp/PilA
MKAVNCILTLLAEDSGISAVEYAIMLSMIGAGMVAAVVGLGSQVGNNINDAATVLKG